MYNLRNIWLKTDRKRMMWERIYTNAFKALLNKQVKEFTNQVTDDNARNADEFIKVEQKPLDNLFSKLYVSVGTSFAKESYRDNKPKARGEDELEDTWADYMTDYAKRKAGSRITSIAESSLTTAQRIIREAIKRGTDEGLGSIELARLIRDALNNEMIPMNTWRALRIARTEVVSASNAGAMKGARDLGLPMNKVWISTIDDRSRDEHAALNGKSIPMEDMFDVGGVPMDMPGDPNAPADEVINCRCTVAYEVRRI